MPASMDMLAIHAREKLGQSINWHAYCFEVKESPYGDFYEVTGVVAPLLTRGANKGKPNWRAKDKRTEATAHIGEQEHQAWVKAWEEKTSTCSVCRNTGKEWTGWSEDTGSRYKPCSRCGGNGLGVQGQLSLSL